MSQQKSPHLERVVLFALSTLPAAAVWWWHARGYLPFMADDAFISLRYSDRLLSGHGLTWTDGPRVEGYSNLLWVLACAAVGLLADLVTASRFVGAASSAAIVAAFGVFGATSRARALAACTAGVALALCGPLAVWTVGGLEQPLLSASVAFGVVGLWWAAESPEDLRRLWWPGAALAAAVWTRPDAPILVAGLALSVLWTHGLRAAVRTWPRLLAIPVSAFAAQLLFRLAYYGEWVPNTARLKVALTSARLAEGLGYVREGLPVLAPLLVAATLGTAALLASEKTRKTALVALVPAVLWTAWVGFMGGDIFPGRRHLVVVLVLLALQAALGLAAAFAASLRFKVAGLAVALGLVFASTQAGLNDSRSQDARDERWEWEGEVSGPFLAQAFAPARPVLAMDAAGALGFFSRLPAIDMLGLNDFDIPRRLPPDWGRSSLSYELHNVGNADSVLSRAPDLIVPCGPLGSEGWCPSVPWTQRLFAHPDFRARYVLMRFAAETPFPVRGAAWLRADSAIVQQPAQGSVRLSPALLARDGGVLRLVNGVAIAELAPGATVRLTHLPFLPARVEVEGDAVEASVVGVEVHVHNAAQAPARVRHVRVYPGP